MLRFLLRYPVRDLRTEYCQRLLLRLLSGYLPKFRRRPTRHFRLG